MKFAQDFKKDLTVLTDALLRGDRFAFIRFGDGESAILRQRERPFNVKRDGETWSSARVSEPTRVQLQEALEADLPELYVATICPACSGQSSEPLRRHVRCPIERQTYAEIFGNANFGTLRRYLTLLRSSVFLVSSHSTADIRIPVDLIERPQEIEFVVRLLLSNPPKKPIALAAGPAACIIGHQLWLNGHRVLPTVVDVGALLDPVLWGTNTRHYMPGGSARRKRVCTWDGVGVGLDTD